MGPYYRFQLLAPPQTRYAGLLGRTRINKDLHDRYFAAMQRFRGGVYLSDGAVQPWQLDEDGRHHMAADEQSWHFLLIDEDDQVIGCARYLLHDPTTPFELLRVRHSALAQDLCWEGKVRGAIENDLRLAIDEGLSYVELGGWALAREWRGTKAALEILLASYAWAQSMGHCICSCTATVRHGSSSILRRIGGQSLFFNDESLPVYHDPQYGCNMELLRFDSRVVDQKFVPLIDQIKAKLSRSVVIAGARKHAFSWALQNEMQFREIGTFVMA